MAATFRLETIRHFIEAAKWLESREAAIRTMEADNPAAALSHVATIRNMAHLLDQVEVTVKSK